jgi:hypothetical protein
MARNSATNKEDLYPSLDINRLFMMGPKCNGKKRNSRMTRDVPNPKVTHPCRESTLEQVAFHPARTHVRVRTQRARTCVRAARGQFGTSSVPAPTG